MTVEVEELKTCLGFFFLWEKIPQNAHIVGIKKKDLQLSGNTCRLLCLP